jgi:hypothetical protein
MRKVLKIATVPDTNDSYARVIALCNDRTVFKSVMQDNGIIGYTIGFRLCQSRKEKSHNLTVTLTLFS